MSKSFSYGITLVSAVLLYSACSQTKKTTVANNNGAYTAAVNLPAPYATPSVRNVSKVIGWPKDKVPVAPEGFT